MDFSVWFETINFGRSIVDIKGSQVIIPNKYFFLWRSFMSLIASSEYPDEMPHFVAFHQSVHNLLKYAFRGN